MSFIGNAATKRSHDYFAIFASCSHSRLVDKVCYKWIGRRAVACSRCRLAHFVKYISTKLRAARATRLFSLVQPIISLSSSLNIAIFIAQIP